MQSEYDVLVAEAHTMGSIAVIRSLGRAGYSVHACSSRIDALGCVSRYAKHRVHVPDYADVGYLDWLRNYVSQQGIGAIVPSEGMLLALRPAWSEFAALLPFSTDEKVVFTGMSKSDVHMSLAAAQETVGANLPPSIVCDSSNQLPTTAELQKLGLPLFLKTDSCHGRGDVAGHVRRVDSTEEALHVLAKLLPSFRRVLVQGFVAGRGVGVFFVLWKKELRAEFMHQRLHEVPHTGGVSSLRESFDHSIIRNDALAKIRHLQWSGPAMLEYRWEPKTNEFYFIELNGRFWGSLHLALYAGVDFPRLLLDEFFGEDSKISNEYRPGLKCRNTFPAEVQYVWSVVKDEQIGIRSKAWSVLEFLLLGLDPRVRGDLLFPGDRGLYFRSAARFLMEVFRGFNSRLRGATRV